LRLPFHQVHPETGYAGGLPWVRNGEEISLGTARYLPYGRPFAVTNVNDMVSAGEYRGVPFFALKGSGSQPKLVFLPAAPHCVVQPYQYMEDVRKKQT
jgi:hypothetical protein